MAASATPTIYDPKRLIAPTLLTTALVTQYTATAAEAGTKLGKCILANRGLSTFAKVWVRDISLGAGDAQFSPDETTDASDLGTADVTIFNTDAVAQGDEFFVGSAEKFSHIAFTLSQVQVGGTTLEIAYGSGAGNPGTYTALVALTADKLVDGTNLLKNTYGEISFVPPAGWVTTTPGSATAGYFIRLKMTAGTITTAPIGSTIFRGTTGPAKVTLHAVPSGGSADSTNMVASEIIVPPIGSGWGLTESSFLDGYMMNASDFLSAKCDVENQIIHHLSGIEMKD